MSTRNVSASLYEKRGGKDVMLTWSEHIKGLRVKVAISTCRMHLFDCRNRVHHTPRCRLMHRYLCVAFMSFGIAYYVLTTTRTHSPLSTHPAATQDAHQPTQLRLSPGRKYLTYLPHSGFHNQRIAFENAL